MCCVGMIDLRGQLHFAEEACRARAVATRSDLERDVATERDLLGEIHPPTPTFPEVGLDAELTKLLTDQRIVDQRNVPLYETVRWSITFRVLPPSPPPRCN
jgi:hypothetical protein